jgi:hypothetical protein
MKKALFCCVFLVACSTTQPTQPQPANLPPQTVQERASNSEPARTFTQAEILAAAKDTFGDASQGLASVIERAFADQGAPVAYIAGDEGGAALGVGVRYGRGYLAFKNGGSTPVYWQGPSVGLDVGGNASKVFTLVYGLRYSQDLYQRFPTVEGGLYVVAGAALNYQRSGDIVLAPIRTGVGLRAGANIGYVHYTREPSLVPF